LCLRGPGAGLALDAARGLSADVFASAAFATNIALWLQSGYFDIEFAKKRLLHLWSLGTEEQFYLIWPLILMLAARLRLNLLTVALAVGLASFVLNVRADRYQPGRDLLSGRGVHFGVGPALQCRRLPDAYR
jgi:peptidoglycan/LPS O-acetylase OafA/YrhL